MSHSLTHAKHDFRANFNPLPRKDKNNGNIVYLPNSVSNLNRCDWEDGDSVRCYTHICLACLRDPTNEAA